MSKKQEEELEKKLRQLEASLKDESQNTQLPSSKAKSTGMSAFDRIADRSGASADEAKTPGQESADLQILGGGIAIAIGIFAVLSHIRVTSGFPMWGGGGEGGLAILGVIAGLGMIFYNYKNKMGWIVLGGTLLATILLVLSRLSLYFVPLDMFGLIFIFLPFALGGALLAKGLIKQKSKEDS